MKIAFLRAGTIVLPPLPKWPGGRTYCTMNHVEQAIRQFSPLCRIEPAKDSTFILVPFDFLPTAIAWTLSLQRQMGGFKKESRDCDDFADAFDLAISWMCSNAGIEAAPAVGCISVIQAEAWANVSAGGSHAPNVIMTERGAVVAEPQNGQFCSMQDYPNRTRLFIADSF